MNLVFLIGRLTKDVDIFKTQNDKLKVSFTLAVNRDNNKKLKEEGKKDADFLYCECWESVADILNRYTKKGSLIAVVGRMEERSYNKQDGTKGYQTYVRVNKITLLDSKPKESTEEVKQEPKQDNPFEEFGRSVDLEAIAITDEDLPF